MSSTPDWDVERDIDNGDAPLHATFGEQVCPGNSSSVRTGSEAVGSGNQRGLREQATCTSVPSSLPTLKAFDPRAEVDTTGKYLVLAPSALMAYLESHFRRALTDDERKAVLTLQPRLATDAMFVPKLDESVKSWIGQKYPKLADGRLFLIQQALHASAGPLTFTWASLLYADPGEAVPVEDVLNIIQRKIVLMGNVNALTTQARQQTVLEAGGTEVAALMKDEMPQAGRHLFTYAQCRQQKRRAPEIIPNLSKTTGNLIGHSNRRLTRQSSDRLRNLRIRRMPRQSVDCLDSQIARNIYNATRVGYLIRATTWRLEVGVITERARSLLVPCHFNGLLVCAFSEIIKNGGKWRLRYVKAYVTTQNVKSRVLEAGAILSG